MFATLTGSDVAPASAYWAVPTNTDNGFSLTLRAYPTVTVTGGSAVEGNSGTRNLQFTVRLSASSQQPITVHYATSDGSATAPGDYTATSGMLTFAPVVFGPAPRQTVTVTVTGDTLYETAETVHLDLSQATQSIIGPPVSDGRITNDDTAPQILIGDARATIQNGQPNTMHFLVALYTKASGAVTKVNYTTSDGTALAGTDYTAVSGTLIIPAGDASTTIDVPIPAQTTASPPKTFTVTLSAPVGATLPATTATGTINNANAAAAKRPE
jgi:chitinase